MRKLKFALGRDHAGYEYKKNVALLLERKGYEVTDFGPFSNDSCDYPDYVHPVADAIQRKECDLGIIICGCGNGVAMTVSKHQGIRCALAWDSEIAQLSLAHDDANIASIPARYVKLDKTMEIVGTFIETEFEGGRHQNRVSKITCTP